jgi:hypothetical protein
MDKATALEALKNANVADYSANQLVADPKARQALQDELAAYYAPGPYGEQLTDEQRDERQQVRLLNLLEASQHGN